MDTSARGLFVGFLFIALCCAIIWTWFRGQKVIRTEKTDAVFGNPERALGGWHWVIAGVSSILLVWLYFSWDAARSFFPKAANELCQVAKVTTALNPIRAVFPIESRLLKGTELLARDGRQLNQLEAQLSNLPVNDADKAQLGEAITSLRTMLTAMADSENLDAATESAIADVAARIEGVTQNLLSPDYPGEPDAATLEKGLLQAGWGRSTTEVPPLPATPLGFKFEAASKELAIIAKDFTGIRNISPTFEANLALVNEHLAKVKTSSETLDPEAQAVRDRFVKNLGKMSKRIDDGNVFPAAALNAIEDAVVRLESVSRDEQGSLLWIDRLAMPSGTIVAGNTACSEQGSGRWLPKPSDTVGTLARLSNPDIGYKGIPLLWYEMRPLSEFFAYFIPDWIADFVPGKYPRHNEDGAIDENFKTKVLNVATGNYDAPSVPVPIGHIWDSIVRVVLGLFAGILLGVPLGLFMGLSRFAKGFFDPLIELYRPVPPLAWAPLILTIFGIQDDGKIFLLFMVAFAIMVISARTGATGTQLSKIHAAHSLGASNRQILRQVILPNSLPEILTGIRIAIGVCWGTLVAAEMLAGTTGIGFVENVARKQSDYETIWMTIILLGLLGLLFDLIMRWVINRTIPWRGKG